MSDDNVLHPAAGAARASTLARVVSRQPRARLRPRAAQPVGCALAHAELRGLAIAQPVGWGFA
jgi:hypothetical protein